MPEQYHIRIANDSLMFSAAHFITFDNGDCEPLHGHDYHVTVELAGPLSKAGYVVDFLAVEAVLREILRPLDHRVLLPDKHPLLRVTRDQKEISAHLKEYRWFFPATHCCVLDIPNTTSELLASWIGQQLLEKLRDSTGFHPETASIEISEGTGRAAVWHWSGE